MLILLTREEVVRALNSPIHPAARALLRLRVEAVEEARFLVAEPADRLPGIEAAFGYPLMTDALPAWDWAIDHGGAFEVAFSVADDMTDVLIVPDDGSRPALIAVLRQNATTPPSTANAS